MKLINWILITTIFIYGCNRNECDISTEYLSSEVFNDTLIDKYNYVVSNDSLIIDFEIPSHCKKVDFLRYYTYIVLYKTKNRCKSYYCVVSATQDSTKVIRTVAYKDEPRMNDTLTEKFQQMMLYMANRMDRIYADYLRNYDSILSDFSEGVNWFETDKSFLEFMYQCETDTTQYGKVICPMVSSAIRHMLGSAGFSAPLEVQNEYDSIISILDISIKEGDSLLNEYID